MRMRCIIPYLYLYILPTKSEKTILCVSAEELCAVDREPSERSRRWLYSRRDFSTAFVPREQHILVYDTLLSVCLNSFVASSLCFSAIFSPKNL